MMKTSYYFDAASYGRRLQAKGVSEQARKSLRTLIPLLFFFLGLLYGALLLKGDSGILAQFAIIRQTTLQERLQGGFGVVFWQSLVSNFLFLFGSALCGLWAVGQPFALFLLLAKGLGLGGFIGSLFLQYGAAGIGYAAVLIVPGAVIGIFALLLSVREAICLSGVLFQTLRGAECALDRKTTKLYVLKQAILLLFLLAASLLDGLTAILSAQWFTL